MTSVNDFCVILKIFHAKNIIILSFVDEFGVLFWFYFQTKLLNTRFDRFFDFILIFISN